MKVTAGLISCLFAGPLLAQARPAPSPRPLSLTQMAARLAEDGAIQRNPRSLMAAAEILRLAERGTVRIRRVSPPTGPLGSWDGPLSSTSLLRLASTLAADQGDWAAADYAAWLLQRPDSEPVTRGAAGGPIWADAYLGRSQELSYTIDFTGGQTANLLQVSAAKASDVLDCTLQEAGQSGRPASRIRSLAGTCALEWRQATSARMTLRIRNTGAATYLVVSSN